MWAVWSVLAAWAYCGSLEINKHYKIEGLTLVFLRSLFASIYLLFLFPFMEFSADKNYYIAALLVGGMSVIGMRIQLNLASQHNGRVAALSQPIMIILSFVIWLFIDSNELEKVMTDYKYTIGILLSFILMVISLQFMRKNDASWRVFLAVLPVGILYAIITILSKLMLDTGESSFGIALSWVWLGNVMVALVSLPLVLHKKLLDINIFVSKVTFRSSLAGSFMHTICWILISLAFISAPNPSYPHVFSAMAPLWFAIYYKMTKQKDKISPLAGFGLAISSIILLFVAG
jgi:hypothetical protein